MQRILLILMTIFFVSCSSEQNIHIYKDNSADIEYKGTISEELIYTIEDWAALNDIDTEEGVLNEEQIETDLKKNPRLTDVSFNYSQSETEGSYSGKFHVNHIEDIFYSEEEIPEELKIFSLTEKEGVSTLTLSISMENYKYLKEILPMLQDEQLDMLGPEYNQEQDVSDEEYDEMLASVLGDTGPKAVRSSSITLNLTFEGDVIKISGGKKINEKKVQFVVPLIKVLLLKEKLEYSVTYK